MTNSNLLATKVSEAIVTKSRLYLAVFVERLGVDSAEHEGDARVALGHGTHAAARPQQRHHNDALF